MRARLICLWDLHSLSYWSLCPGPSDPCTLLSLWPYPLCLLLILVGSNKLHFCSNLASFSLYTHSKVTYTTGLPETFNFVVENEIFLLYFKVLPSPKVKASLLLSSRLEDWSSW